MRNILTFLNGKSGFLSAVMLLGAGIVPEAHAQQPQFDPATKWFSQDRIDPRGIVRVRISSHLDAGTSEEGSFYYTDGTSMASLSNAEKAGPLEGNSVGVDVSYTHFFIPHLALELSLGTQFSESSGKTFNRKQGDAIINSVSKEGSITSVPFSAIAQYHIAPYGDLTPYVGAGFSYNYFFSEDIAEYDAATGPVLQAGFDVWKDQVGVNFDVKKYFWNKVNGRYDWASELAPDVAYFESEADRQPWVLSVGLNYRF